MNRIKPIVLAIVDGWGIAPPGKTNAIAQAKTPHFDRFIAEYPALSLFARGQAVGLRAHEYSNTHIGHLNIGAGRICYQILARIDAAIAEGSFFENKILVAAIAHAQKSILHVIGILSNSGCHGSIEHVKALLKLAKMQGLSRVFVHAILDGETIDSLSGLDFVVSLEQYMQELGIGKIATVMGCYFAMDRDRYWERTEQAYRAIVEVDAENRHASASDAIRAWYESGGNDKNMIPTVIIHADNIVAHIQAGDTVIFSNFRADRMQQLVKALVLPHFSKFERLYIPQVDVVTMNMYEKELPVHTAFKPLTVFNNLSEWISKAGLNQLYIVETQKYADMTYFLHGNTEEVYEGEAHIVVPSSRIKTGIDKPQMSAHRITKHAIQAVQSDRYHTIFVNYTNMDSLARSAHMDATIKAVEFLDKQLGELAEYVRAKDGILCITSSIGGAEEIVGTDDGMMLPTIGKNSVPFIVVGDEFRGISSRAGDPLSGDLSLVKPAGVLADVAPTILKLLGLEQPEEMTGRVLI